LLPDQQKDQHEQQTELRHGARDRAQKYTDSAGEEQIDRDAEHEQRHRADNGHA
jgi:hypothetical protein